MDLPEKIREILFDRQASYARELSRARDELAESLERATTWRRRIDELEELLETLQRTLSHDDSTTRELETVELPLPVHLSPRRRKRS